MWPMWHVLARGQIESNMAHMGHLGEHQCLSFEYSPASKNCYLNKVGQPSAANVGSFILCTKTTNTPVLEAVIGTVPFVISNSRPSKVDLCLFLSGIVKRSKFKRVFKKDFDFNLI